MKKSLYYFSNTKNYCLTIDDVKNWEIGKEYELCLFDWNFEETKIWTLKKGELYKPTDFFSANKNKYVHRGQFEGHMYFNYGEDREFNDFYIEYEPSRYKMINHLQNCENIKNICIVCKNEKNIIPDDFPPNTRIGWRGPMVLWSDIIELEKKGYMFHW